MSRSIFRAARKNHAGAFIFEIERTEIGCTHQRPAEYAAVILAAAIKEGFEYPVFIQGDHFQINAKKYEKDKNAEIHTVKGLIKEGIDAGFYNIDIDTLRNLSKAARDGYALSGAVQHGASTLPPDAFDKFPETGTAEVHLATEFQNMIYESSVFPQDFKKEIYDFLKNHPDIKKEWIEGDTEEQFLYKARKNGFGTFKERFWNLSADVRKKIGDELETKFDFLFKILNVIHSKEVINKTIKPVEVSLPNPPSFP